ncbi:MAG: hypothetical protein AAF757_32800, partial [Cyanobacteria bacterium P01_D01_bin.116]
IALSKEGFKDKVKELFTSNQFKADNSSIKVIAYTNNRVDEINQVVKDTLYGENAPEYLPGMRIIARDPVKGEVGTALDTAEEMTITKAEKNKSGNLDVWNLEGINENGDRVEFETLDSESKPEFKRELDNLRTEIYSQPATERDWSEYYDLAEKFGNVRPAYAITAHNSQGKTIPQGIVDQNNLNLRLSMALNEVDAQERARGIKEYNQLRYVAMTRFQNAVYVGTNQREQEINRSQTKDSSLQNTKISLPSSQEADKNKSLEIIGKISESKVDQLRQHLETNYQPLMDADRSSYAPGRQVAWVEAKWELKDKDFSPAVKDDKLMELVKQVYPDADIA